MPQVFDLNQAHLVARILNHDEPSSVAEAMLLAS